MIARGRNGVVRLGDHATRRFATELGYFGSIAFDS